MEEDRKLELLGYKSARYLTQHIDREWVFARDMAKNFGITTQELIVRCLHFYPDGMMPVIVEKADKEFLIDAKQRIYSIDDRGREIDTGCCIGDTMTGGLILEYDEILVPADCDDDLWCSVEAFDGFSGFEVWENEDGEIAIIPDRNRTLEWSLLHLLSSGIGDSQGYKYRGGVWDRDLGEGLRDYLIKAGVRLEAKNQKINS